MELFVCWRQLNVSSEKVVQKSKGDCSLTVAPLQASGQQEAEKGALLVQLGFTAEDNTNHKSAEAHVFLEGEENSGSKIKRCWGLMFHNCVLSFPGLIPVIFSVCGQALDNTELLKKRERKEEKGGRVEGWKKMSLWGLVGGRELLSSPDRDLNWM